MSYVPKPQFWPRIRSPWLGLGSNLARMNPMASRNRFNPSRPSSSPFSAPRIKILKLYRQTPEQPPQRPLRYMSNIRKKHYTYK